MQMYVLEYLHAKFPKLPAEILREAVEVYTRSATLDLMSKEFGVDDVARWARSKVTRPPSRISFDDSCSSGSTAIYSAHG